MPTINFNDRHKSATCTATCLNTLLFTPHLVTLLHGICTTNIRPQTCFSNSYYLHNNPFNVVIVPFWCWFWWFFESFFSSSTPHHGHPKQPTLPPNGRIHSHPPNLSGPALTNYKVLVVQSPKPSPLAPWSVYAGNFVGCAPSHDNLLTGFLRKKGY